MRAMVMKSYGDNGVVDVIDVPTPTPAPGEVAIDVHAAGLNPLDFKTRNGALRGLRSFAFPAVMGNELAGVVRALGDGVTGFAVGDEVYARVDKGAYGAVAEVACVPATFVARKPASLSMVQAAGVPLAALTALQALREELKVGPGYKLFIPAGAGGVGTFAIQIARILGAAEVATTASSAGRALVERLGAAPVVDYRSERFEEKLHDLDGVFDTLGGDELERQLGIVRKGGAICSIAGAPVPSSAGQMGAPAWIAAVFWFLSAGIRWRASRRGITYTYLFMRPDGAQLAELAGWIDAGRLEVIVDREFPLDEAPAALAYLEQGRAKGKVIVRVRG